MNDKDKLAKALFVLSTLGFTFGAGVVFDHFDIPPVPQLKAAFNAIEELRFATGLDLPWYYVPVEEMAPVAIEGTPNPSPGLTLVAGVGPNDDSRIQIIRSDGSVVHEWIPDWFEIWPTADHVHPANIPQSRGGLIHGVMLMPDGGITFNFEELSLVRMDACGEVMWKLPHLTHHSVTMANDGTIWVPSNNPHWEPVEKLPNYHPPFDDYSIMQVTTEGEILQEHSVFDLLLRNGLDGLLYMQSLANRWTTVFGDSMHLNEIEIFPDDMEPGVFEPGDIMLSLRNINAIIVFDPDDWSVKFMSIGRVIRQHDPDFIDGNTISVFDNYNVLDPEYPSNPQSRIVEISAIDGSATVTWTGTPEEPFFTDIMGQHQMLPNGNMILVESILGRVLEVDSDGEPVWGFRNQVTPELTGLISGAIRLPPEIDEAFFAESAAACPVG